MDNHDAAEFEKLESSEYVKQILNGHRTRKNYSHKYNLMAIGNSDEDYVLMTRNGKIFKLPEEHKTWAKMQLLFGHQGAVYFDEELEEVDRDNDLSIREMAFSSAHADFPNSEKVTKKEVDGEKCTK